MARTFEEIPAVVLAFAGPDMRVIAANRTARHTIGVRPNVVGEPIREAMPELSGQQIYEVIERVYTTGEPVVTGEQRVLWDRDGDGDLEEAFFSVTFSPTRDAAGGVDGVLVLGVETTALVRQRQAAESRAVHSERRYQQARDVVLALQRSLLPDALPALPRVRLSARYVVADAEAAAGGDWFDAQPLPDGRVALTVGDVVGHGAAAAGVMGQLRAALLQAVTSGASITETLTRLEGLAGHLPAARGATVCLALLDPVSGDVEYASRAHPMPLGLDREGPARFLAGTPDPPLSTGDPGTVTVRRDRLAAGQMLLLYTDGLVERPARTFAAGQQELAMVAAAALTEPVGGDTTVPEIAPDRVCELVVERFAWAGYQDDVTLLVAELMGEPLPPLRLEIPATVGELRPMRERLGEWLARLGAAPAAVNALLHAVWEACGNAVEHGYRDHPDPATATIGIEGDLAADATVRVVVTDRGRWLPAPVDPEERGRGLMMMRSMVDRVSIVPSETGTRVTIRHRLSRAVTVGSSPDRSGPRRLPGAGAADFRTELARSEHPVLSVSGPVDQSSADRLRTEILAASRGGALPLTVDLSDVTHLASVGVRLLHQLVGSGSSGMRMRAAEGTPADQVLTLTGLAHTP